MYIVPCKSQAFFGPSRVIDISTLLIGVQSSPLLSEQPSNGLLTLTIMKMDHDDDNKIITANPAKFTVFSNPIYHRATFNIGNGQQFQIEECLQDSELVFIIPQIMLKQHIQDEERILSALTKQSPLICSFPFYGRMLDMHSKNIEQLTSIIGELVDYHHKPGNEPEAAKNCCLANCNDNLNPD